jgi:hypothetical protein
MLRVAVAAVALLATATGIVVACFHSPTLEERVAQQIVATKFDPAANFASFSTFAMPDSVAFFMGSIDAGPTFVDNAVAAQTLAEIASQLTARGYRQVARTAGPDLGVAVTGIARLQVQTPVTFGDWHGLGSSSSVFWGFSGGVIVSPFLYQTVAWETGALVMELFDLRDAAGSAAVVTDGGPTPILDVIWAGIIHGVIGPQGSTIQSAPIESIQQAFAQSPYIAAAPASPPTPPSTLRRLP